MREDTIWNMWSALRIESNLILYQVCSIIASYDKALFYHFLKWNKFLSLLLRRKLFFFCIRQIIRYIFFQDGLTLYHLSSSWSLIWEIALKGETQFSCKSNQDSIPYPFAMIYLACMIIRRYFVLRSFYSDMFIGIR